MGAVKNTTAENHTFSPAGAGEGGKCAFDTERANMTLIVVRTDIPLAQQMVQACHASALAGTTFSGWQEDTRMALLAAKDETALIAAGLRLHQLGISFCEFSEPDHGIGFSALASAPIAWKKARKALPSLPLWGQHPQANIPQAQPQEILHNAQSNGEITMGREMVY